MTLSTVYYVSGLRTYIHTELIVAFLSNSECYSVSA